MPLNILGRPRRTNVHLGFTAHDETTRIARHETGTFVVSTRDVCRGAEAYLHRDPQGYVLLGQARGLDAAEGICGRAAAHLSSERPLIAAMLGREHGEDALQAVVANRTLDGGLSLTLFGLPSESLTLNAGETRDFLAGRIVVKRIGEGPADVRKPAELLAECAAAQGLFSPAERFEASWGMARILVDSAHNRTVSGAERSRDYASLEMLRAYQSELSRGMLPHGDVDGEAAEAASHLWDNFAVQRALDETPVAGFLAELAERHGNRVRRDLYHPFM